MIKKFLETVLDIGLKRFFQRIIFEIHQKLSYVLPSKLNYLLTNPGNKIPDLRENLNELK